MARSEFSTNVNCCEKYLRLTRVNFKTLFQVVLQRSTEKQRNHQVSELLPFWETVE